MRFSLLLLFSLLGANSFFAQETRSSEAYIEISPRHAIYDTKWYLNAVQISNFYWNDTSVLITSMPKDSKFIRFRDKFEFGEDRPPKDLTENIFKEYQVEFTDYDDSDDSQFEGVIYTYKNKRNRKRVKNSTDYYNFILTNCQLILLHNEPESNVFENLYHTKTLIFSRNKDSLELTTKILGSWKPGQLQNLLLLDSDTLTLEKVPTVSISNPEFTYNFAVNDGYPTCTSDFFSLQDEDHVWSSDYQAIQYDFALDIENRQLIIFNQLYSQELDKVFDIIELTESEMKLALHQEFGIMGPPK